MSRVPIAITPLKKSTLVATVDKVNVDDPATPCGIYTDPSFASQYLTTVYADRTSGTTIANPVIPLSNGAIPGFVEAGNGTTYYWKAGAVSGQFDTLGINGPFAGIVYSMGKHTFDMTAPAYGGKGDWDGATGTDNLPAFNAAKAAAKAAGGGEIKQPAGAYMFSSYPQIDGSNIQWLGSGPGATHNLVKDGPGNVYALSVGWVWGSQPTVGVFTPLSDTQEGQTTFAVPVGTGSQYAPGMYLFLQGTDPYGSHVSKIESVSGDTLNLSDSFEYLIPALGSTARVYNNMRSGIRVADMAFDVIPLTANNGVPVYVTALIATSGVDNCDFERLWFNNSAYYAFDPFFTRDVQLKNFHVERCPGGVTAFHSQNHKVHQGWFERSQFGITAAACPNLVWDDITIQGSWPGWPNPAPDLSGYSSVSGIFGPNTNLDNFGRGFKTQSCCVGAKISKITCADHDDANRLIDAPRTTLSDIIVRRHGYRSLVSGGRFDHALQIDGLFAGGVANLSDQIIISNYIVEDATACALAVFYNGSDLSATACAHAIRVAVHGFHFKNVNTAGFGDAVALYASRIALIGGSVRNWGAGARGIYAANGSTKHRFMGTDFDNGGSGTAIHTSDSAGGSVVGKTQPLNVFNGEAVSYAASDV